MSNIENKNKILTEKNLKTLLQELQKVFAFKKDVSENCMEKNNAVGTGSFSINRKYDSVIGSCSFAVGKDTTASGLYSFAEGYGTSSYNLASHSEGNNSVARGDSSHAEGQFNTAEGRASHSEGISTATTSSATASHVEGYNTIAGSKYQHVEGKWNIVDESNSFAHIIGNGIDKDNRSNAYVLDWTGNALYSGFVQGKTLQVSSANYEISAVEKEGNGNWFNFNANVEIPNQQLEAKNIIATERFQQQSDSTLEAPKYVAVFDDAGWMYKRDIDSFKFLNNITLYHSDINQSKIELEGITEEDLKNFEKIEIYYKNNDGQKSSVSVCDLAINDKILLSTNYIDSNSLWVKTAVVQVIKENEKIYLDKTSARAYSVKEGTNTAVDNIQIIKVVGYKK